MPSTTAAVCTCVSRVCARKRDSKASTPYDSVDATGWVAPRDSDANYEAGLSTNPRARAPRARARTRVRARVLPPAVSPTGSTPKCVPSPPSPASDCAPAPLAPGPAATLSGRPSPTLPAMGLKLASPASAEDGASSSSKPTPAARAGHTGFAGPVLPVARTGPGPLSNTAAALAAAPEPAPAVPYPAPACSAALEPRERWTKERCRSRSSAALSPATSSSNVSTPALRLMKRDLTSSMLLPDLTARCWKVRRAADFTKKLLPANAQVSAPLRTANSSGAIGSGTRATNSAYCRVVGTGARSNAAAASSPLTSAVESKNVTPQLVYGLPLSGRYVVPATRGASHFRTDLSAACDRTRPRARNLTQDHGDGDEYAASQRNRGVAGEPAQPGTQRCDYAKHNVIININSLAIHLELHSCPRPYSSNTSTYSRRNHGQKLPAALAAASTGPA